MRSWRFRLVFLFIVGGSAPPLCGETHDADFYVALNGNDAWSGSMADANPDGTDGPLATIERARELVRALRAAEPDRQRPVIVSVRGGRHTLEHSLRFSPEDSGTPSSPTIYAAFEDERPVLSGGVALSGWQVAGDRWRVDLPDVAAGRWAFAQLFVNDQRRYRPRLPKQGYFKIEQGLPASFAGKRRGFDRFRFSGSDLQPTWANLRDVEAIIFHQWNISRLRIESIDPNSHTVNFTGPTEGREFAAGDRSRYLVENVKESLSEPGEWYLDRATGELIYLPMPGETPENTVIIAPRLARLVEFRADTRRQRWVEHLEFHGLTFAHSNWELPGKGQSIAQAEVLLPAAIEATGARNVSFMDCVVRHTGAYGIALGKGCQDNTIQQCELVDLAAGGIMIGTMGGVESWGGDDPELHADAALTTRNAVRNCTIAHGGRMHPAGVGVWIGHATHNTITHNDIFDFYYTGISVGWQWGYAKSRSNHNRIAFNYIHTIGQGVLSDMAGVYTLGVSPGTVVAKNVIHDVKSFDYGGWGLYTDEGSTGILMENNLVYRTKSGGFHQHYGRDNRIANNIFAFGTQHQLQRTRVERHTSFTFVHNIVYWDSAAPLMEGPWREPGIKLDYNIYWSTAEEPIDTIDGLTFEDWQRATKQDTHSRVADPQFIDPQKGDFQLRPTSSATQLGFVPFDYTKAGRETPAKLTTQLPDVPKAFD